MELLSPAGDREALIAAIRNGADAVYLGGQVLNARRSAGNFDRDGLKWACDYCHERGRKVYVTVNVLVKQRELGQLGEIASDMAFAGADAAIVQDLGAASALRQMLPDLPLFASTQMAVHSRHGVRFLKQAGFARAVLAREMTLAEIVDCAGEGLPLEVFCHGALCVSCSGQCLFSSLVGGRSGNRGQCAQPCRLPYKLTGPLIEAAGHLLSPRDLMLLGQLDQLRAAGADSLKIEGRLKRPEYVAIVTRIYRAALDGQATGERAVRELKQIFNRGGFTQGYAPGLIDRDLIYDGQPNHLGVRVGELKAGRAALACAVSDRDLIVSRAAGREDAPYKPGAPDGELFRLADDQQLRAARESYEGAETPGIAITGEATIRVGQPLALSVSDGETQITYFGEIVQRAQNKPLDEDKARNQLTKTGGTPYRFDELRIHIDQDAFAPVSQLNELRRAALGLLAEARIERNRGCGLEVQPLLIPQVAAPKPGKSRLVVQSGDADLLDQALAWGADEIVYQPLDFINFHAPNARFTLALPMVCSDQDLMTLHAFAKVNEAQLDGVLIANVAQLALDWPGESRADFSMNVANDLTVQALGMPYAPSVELTAKEISQMGGDRELIVYGRLPLMQLRHCPLNARLGKGRHIDCRRCDAGAGIEEHRLTDRKGIGFPLQRLKTAGGCIVRVLNSVPLMVLRHQNKLPGAACWRILLTDETRDETQTLVRAHRAALDGRKMPELGPLPTTTGHYFRGVD